ncbi:MAG: U32 family peptidase [Bacteroidaceae bacterium]|nr:U32 family peptidase [Bacteroidaceae bacterium]
MPKEIEIELLSPAKNLECGIAAIDHGADAVYIGADKYGARAAAGNSLEDISKLVEYAHQFRVKVYVTVNTILKEEELSDTEKLIHELYEIGVDALIVQDMAIASMNIPPIPLHASTQMNNCSADKVKFLQEMGFEQAVLARELTLDEIKEIHKSCDIKLEAFIHGALCVSYNGQCYASQHCFGRSANRGECAQFCRLPFTLTDANGEPIINDKHLLSMKDLNQSANLEKMIDAGVTSLKIEGRLKDVGYVKNVTAFYRQKLDSIFSRRKEYKRSSVGRTELTFTPQLDKSFNRGFTTYFIDGRQPNISSPISPKSFGEPVGSVKAVGRGWLTVAGLKKISNGDGLCFINSNGTLQGFRVNKVEDGKVFPLDMPNIKPKTPLFRNFDRLFDAQLSKQSAIRQIPVTIELSEVDWGFQLTAKCQGDKGVSINLEQQKELARTPQTDNITKQLSKLGGTAFVADKIIVNIKQNWFIPSSLLADWRRQLIERLTQQHKTTYPLGHIVRKPNNAKYPESKLSYRANVFNRMAADFYKSHGVNELQPAYEVKNIPDVPIMYCKYCIKHEIGICSKKQGARKRYKEPFYLMSKDGKKLRLEFNCKECRMNVYATD